MNGVNESRIEGQPELAPESPFNPFNDSTDEEMDMGEDGQTTSSLKELFQENVIAPMPTTLPPPPPMTPSSIGGGNGNSGIHQDRHCDEEKIESSVVPAVASRPRSPTIPPPAPPSSSSPYSHEQRPTVAIIPDEAPLTMPSTGASSSKQKKKSKKKKAKKDKDKKKTKKSSKMARNEGIKSDKRMYNKNTYHQQQYNTIQPINYDNEGNGNDKNKLGGMFSSLLQPNPSHVTSLFPNKPGQGGSRSAGSGRRKNLLQSMDGNIDPMSPRSRLMRVNIGVANSADGEGTTIPQILHRMRVMTLALSLLTITFEAWAMIFNTIFLKADKVILGCYLLFFVGLLLCFEFVRGTPKAHSISMMSIIHQKNNMQLQQNASQMADIVWRNALEEKWARRLRHFLQDNFGIFYSCIGRAFFFLVIGGMAFGQDFIVIQIIGLGFMFMGFWLITLRIRYPALEKALIMTGLEDEFGDKKQIVSNNDNESVVSWSNVSGSSLGGTSNPSNSERMSLLANRPQR